jgi:hypothetical protein
MSHFNIARGLQIPAGSAANPRPAHRKKCVQSRNTRRKKTSGAQYVSRVGKRELWSTTQPSGQRAAQSHSPSAAADCESASETQRRRQRCNNARAEGGAASGRDAKPAGEQTAERNRYHRQPPRRRCLLLFRKVRTVMYGGGERVYSAPLGESYTAAAARHRGQPRPTHHPPRPRAARSCALFADSLPPLHTPSVQFSRTAKGTQSHFE